MKSYFADTSYWLALELNNDQNHEAALKHWQNLVQTTFAIATTSYIFDETITYLNSRNHHEKAVEVGENLLLSPTIELVHVDENLFLKVGQCFKNIKTSDIR